MNTNETKHTPGPWKANIESEWSLDTEGSNAWVTIGPDDHHAVAIVGVESAFDLDDELDANAALISASPEMLEELQRIVRIIDEDGGRYTDTSKAKAIIRKATTPSESAQDTRES